MHFLAGISTLLEHNLSLTANNEFEVHVNDSTSGVEWRAPFLFATAPMHTTGSARRCCSGDTCKPVSERTQYIGCWILADNPGGQLAKPRVFRHLDAYPTRDAAEADKGPRGTVIESFTKVWLMTIEDENWKSTHGNRIERLDRRRVLHDPRSHCAEVLLDGNRALCLGRLV